MKRAIIILLLAVAGLAKANIRVIELAQVIAEARMIRMITVYGYNDSTLFYGVKGRKDTLQVLCLERNTSAQFREDMINQGLMKKTDLAGIWPAVGEKVLMVQNAAGRVVVFARKLNKEYRFWDPNTIPFANSVFAIPKGSYFIPLSDCKDTDNTANPQSWYCPDGCLAPMRKVKEKG